MKVQCSKCGGDTDTGFRCVKCGHSMQPQENSCTQPTDTQHTHAAIVLAQNYMAPFSYGSTIRQVMEGFIVWLDEQQQHV